MTPHQRKIKGIVLKLLEWFSKHARDLPWRRTVDPYAIWVSEIMLQQTQVKTVVPYWERWMRELPDVPSLAKASAARIHKLWEGLGYYTRVRNMQAAARHILQQPEGQFPQSFDAVLALPGVGRYTAGAICSLAFGQPTPVLDGNVIRVLSRVFEMGGNPKDRKVGEQFWRVAETLVRTAAREPDCALAFGPVIRPCSALNQSLMELGAVVCAPKAPRCGECPLNRICGALRNQTIDRHPALPPRVAPSRRRFAAFLIRNRSRVLAVQRPGGVVNAHLWELPNVELDPKHGNPEQAAVALLGVAPTALRLAMVVRHSITRYRIQLEVYETEATGARLPGAEWLSPRQLRQAAFTGAHRKAVDGLVRPG